MEHSNSGAGGSDLYQGASECAGETGEPKRVEAGRLNPHFTRKTVRHEFANLDAFLRRWNLADQQQAIIQELEERGVVLETLVELVGKDFDPFDLICHIAYDQPPLSRKERADQVRKRDYFTKCGEEARAVLEVLLNKYADQGVENLEDLNVLKMRPLKDLGTPIEIIQRFGSRQQCLPPYGNSKRSFIG